MTFTETLASEDPPSIEFDAVKHATTRNVLIKTTQGKTVGSEVTSTTSISASND